MADARVYKLSQIAGNDTVAGNLAALGFASLTPPGPPGSRVRQLVATRGNDLGGGRLQDTSSNGRTYLERVWLPYGGSGLTFRFGNYYASTYYENPLGNDIYVKHSAWADSSGSTRYPGTFGGQRSILVPGTLIVGAEVESDPMGLYYGPGSYVWVATYVKPTTATRTVTISGTPTGGTFTITVNSQTTAGIAFNATAAAVLAAIQALSSFTAGSYATVTGSAGGPYTIVFSGSIAMASITVTASAAGLTGGTPAIAVANAGTSYFPIGTNLFCASGATGEGFSIGSDVTDSGSVGAANDTFSYTPTAIRGYVAGGPKVTISIGPGDSISRGTGDTDPALGFLVRATGTAQYGAGGNFPWIGCSRGGELYTDQVGTRGYVRTMRSALATDLLVDTGTNDIFTGLVTLATLQSRAIAQWQQHGQAGGRIRQTTYVPRTSTTDNFATLANQAVLGAESVRVAANNWLYDGAPMSAGAAVAVGTSGASRCAVYDYTGTLVTAASGPAGHPLACVIDSATTVEVNSSGTRTRNGGFWRVDGFAVSDSGTATSATSTTLADSTKAWTVNAWYGKRLVITSGTGSGQYATIQSNTAAAITVAGSWGTTPDATSHYQIDNSWALDGTHPTTPSHVAMSVPVAAVLAAITA